MDINEMIIKTVLFFLPLLGIYLSFKGNVVRQENRLTLLEKDVENLKIQVGSNIKRLNDYEKQTLVLVQLTEQVKSLSEDIKRIEKKLERGG